jgi:hypothetical protein
MEEKNPENHIVGFLINLYANYGEATPWESS